MQLSINCWESRRIIQQKKNILIAEKNGIKEEQRHQMKRIEEKQKRMWRNVGRDQRREEVCPKTHACQRETRSQGKDTKKGKKGTQEEVENVPLIQRL